jgi:Ca-activated chloride channel homolog
MIARLRRFLPTLFILLLGAAGLYAYFRFAYNAPVLTFKRGDTTYELLSPKMLGIALLAPYFLFVIGKSLTDLPWPQRLLSAVVRSCVIALLALGLSRFAKTSTESRVCTVYMVDVSESIPDEALKDAHDEIEKALREKPKDALLRVITFARRPRAVEIAEGAVTFPEIARHDIAFSTGGGDESKGKRTGLGGASDIQSALKLAYGLFPSGYVRRAVLISDGVETDGDVMAESRRAKDFGVRIFTRAPKRAVPAEIAIRDLRVPDRVRVGETFALHAQVFSSRAQKARLTLKQGEAINGLDGVREVDLKAGENDVPFKSVVRVAGEVTYSVELSGGGAGAAPFEDRFKENNRYSVTVAVPGRPTVLYVEGNTSRASYLSSALSAQEFDVDVRGPREAPQSVRELERYDMMILSDAPAESMSLTQQDAIEQYVRDVGGGFVFAGGENGFGLGGWAHSTLERILPVRMDAEKKRDEPQVAMVLVIDRSGSMSGIPLDMAKAAARATADTLSAEDMLEVIAFDSQPTRVVRLTAAKHRARIQSDIGRIEPGGGTEIFSALDAAYQTLTATRAKRKHVILLTDGQAPNQGIRDLVSGMAAEGITVSSVGLGAGVDEALLRGISEGGSGRFYKVLDPQQLPRVFTRETEMVSRNAAVEEYFQPKVVTPADFLRSVDIGSAPFLHGYVATRMKPPPAQEILSSEVGEPVLARWRVGLGWSLAWTSDVKNLWAVEWLRWPGYGQFWGQLVREHMRSKRRQEFSLHSDFDQATGTVRAYIDAIDSRDQFQDGLETKLTVRGPEGVQGASETRSVPMKQTAPGRYQAEFALERFGSYVLHGVLEKPPENGKGKSVQVAESFGHVQNPYPREYLAFEPDKNLLERLAASTGASAEPADVREVFDAKGEVVTYHKDLWSRFVLAAIALYLVDVLLRRVRLFDGRKTVST